MFRIAKQLLIGAALLAGVAAPAAAADLYQPPVVEAPPPVYVPEPVPEFGGWYIRGDLGYKFPGWKGADYITYGCAGCGFNGPQAGTNSFQTGSLRGAFSFGGGIGFQANKYARFDFTGDYMLKSGFLGSTAGTACTPAGVCTSSDTSNMSALLLLANAYADLGTYGRVTPYVGAGIGGARISWDGLVNAATPGGVTTHAGASSWRFAWALMAGASVCVTNNIKLDAGYRYANIAGGRMFEFGPAGSNTGAGPGFDRGFDVHEVRAGLRYQFGGGSDCGGRREYVSYEPMPEPAPEPVYRPVYKQ